MKNNEEKLRVQRENKKMEKHLAVTNNQFELEPRYTTLKRVTNGASMTAENDLIRLIHC